MSRESDPVKRLERELAEQEKALASHREMLRRQIDALRNPPPAPPRQTVWRRQEEPSDARRVELAAARRLERVHGAQRRRDKIRFVLLALAFGVVVIWLVRLL